MKAIGIINIVVGSLYITMNLIGLLLIYIEKVIFSSIPQMEFNEFVAFDISGYFNDIFNLMLISVPVSVIAYSLMLIGGIRILGRNETGIGLTKTSSWIIILWFIIYILYAYYIFSPYIEQFTGETVLLPILYFFCSLVGFVFTCGYPVFLLIYFNKPRQFSP